jgi:endonuclease/exonuclease/phosphatase family metal-dependent hydrolase
MPLRHVALACLTALLLAPPLTQEAVAGTTGHESGSATAKRSVTLRVVTFNVFQDLGLDEHRSDWEALKRRADVVLLQETAGFRVSDMVTGNRWQVFQGQGLRGESAVVVRRSAVRSTGRLHVRHVLAPQDCNRAGIGPRYLVSAVLVLRDGSRLWVTSTHLPHAGCSDAVYDEMVSRVQTWVGHHHQHLVIGADWNRDVESDPGDFRSRTRLRPHGVGIDGFQVDRRLGTKGTRALGSEDDWLSDHEPVRITIGS